MTQATIGKGNPVFTVIFDFDVKPEQQKELSEKLPKLVEDIVSKQPGFISAHLHLSTDGKKALNYFQWESKEVFDAFRQNEDAQQHIRPVLSQYGPTPRIFEIVYSVVS